MACCLVYWSITRGAWRIKKRSVEAKFDGSWDAFPVSGAEVFNGAWSAKAFKFGTSKGAHAGLKGGAKN